MSTSSNPAEPGFQSAPPHLGPGVRLDPTQVEDLSAAARIFGCELLHIGRMGSALQLVIDHPDGVTVDHCADVSRQASAILDRDDYGTTRYVLEVTSPGIERELYRPVDYQRFLGEQIRVTFRADDGGKKTIEGELSHCSGERISVLESQQTSPHSIPLADVLKARLVVEF